MRVATYNIASGHTFETYAQTGKSVFDPMRIASFIDTLGADVITLNEIASQFSTEDGTINEVEQIAEHCGYEASAFARGTVFPPTRDLGNAMLSKFPILEARVMPIRMSARMRYFWLTFDRHNGSDYNWSYGNIYCFEAEEL